MPEPGIYTIVEAVRKMRQYCIGMVPTFEKSLIEWHDGRFFVFYDGTKFLVYPPAGSGEFEEYTTTLECADSVWEPREDKNTRALVKTIREENLKAIRERAVADSKLHLPAGPTPPTPEEIREVAKTGEIAIVLGGKHA